MNLPEMILIKNKDLGDEMNKEFIYLTTKMRKGAYLFNQIIGEINRYKYVKEMILYIYYYHMIKYYSDKFFLASCYSISCDNCDIKKNIMLNKLFQNEKVKRKLKSLNIDLDEIFNISLCNMLEIMYIDIDCKNYNTGTQIEYFMDFIKKLIIAFNFT